MRPLWHAILSASDQVCARSGSKNMRSTGYAISDASLSNYSPEHFVGEIRPEHLFGERLRLFCPRACRRRHVWVKTSDFSSSGLPQAPFAGEQVCLFVIRLPAGFPFGEKLYFFILLVDCLVDKRKRISLVNFTKVCLSVFASV